MASFACYKMKYHFHISLVRKALVFGFVLMALFSSCTEHTFRYELTQKAAVDSDASDQQEQSESDDQEFRLPASLAVLHLMHIQLHFASYLIKESPLIDVIIYEYQFEEPAYISGYFKTLFRFIIGPNAP